MELNSIIKVAAAMSVLALVQLPGAVSAKPITAFVNGGKIGYKVTYDTMSSGSQISKINPRFLPAQSLNPNSAAFIRAAAMKLRAAALAEQASNSRQATNVSQSQQAQQARQYRMPQESQPRPVAQPYTLPGRGSAQPPQTNAPFWSTQPGTLPTPTATPKWGPFPQANYPVPAPNMLNQQQLNSELRHAISAYRATDRL